MLRFLLLFLPLSLSAFPLRFELNQGFISAGGIAFTKSGPLFPGGVRMTLVGARSTVPETGAPAGRVSYLVGRDPKGWRLGVPQYGEVRYREIYPGIDLLFHDSAGKLEYDFRLRPGADPDAIRLRFRGADRVRLDGEDLVAGSLRHHRPVAFQESLSGRLAVAARYRLHDGEVRLELGPYDRGLPLVIDPVLSYATYAGGSGSETGTAIAVDTAGNAYLAGTTDSPNFPALKAASYSTAHAFVVKLDASGANFTSMVVIGGATIDGIAMDSTGNPVVAGSITDAALFPGATAGAYQAGATGFVARLTQDASGFKLAFVSTFAATPAAVALDAAGGIYVAGSAGLAFVTTPGALQTVTAGGTSDAFVLKLSPDGARTLYATYLGGKAGDAARAIAVNLGGEAYIAGDTASADFPVTPGAAQSKFAGPVIANPFFGSGYGDAFVAKLNASGASLVFSTYLGGAAPDIAYGIALDNDGNAYVAGSTQSDDFPTTAGTFQPKYAGGTPVSTPDPSGDAFLARFSANGERIWSTFLGGSDRDIAEAIAVDRSGNVVVAGTTDSANFPRTAGALAGCRTGGPWVAQMDSAGTKLLVSTSLPGMGLDEPHALALDAKGIAYVAGDVASRLFFAASAAAQAAYGGGDSDAFVARLDLTASTGPLVSCVLNAASFQAGNFSAFPLGTVAPGEIVSLFGAALGLDRLAFGQPDGGFFPTTLGGVRVLFDGVPAPLLYVGPTQINAIVPNGIKSPVTQMTVQNGILSDGPHALPVAPAVPAIFTANSAGFGQAAVLNEDGTYNSVSNPAARGSTITLWAVGAGVMSPAVTDGAVSPGSLPLPVPQLPLTVQIRGMDALVQYAGAAPGSVSGLLQVNVRVPDSVSFGNSVPLTLLVGGQPSQFNVTIAVKF